VWLGSNIGNFTRTEAASFLGGMHASLGAEDRLLVGIDTCRDPDVLLRAYDDRAGVTAAFGKNLLARINRELGGHFNLGAFRHQAEWDEDASRVELSLVSLQEQRVRIDALELEVSLYEGESIHTEWSCKYARRDIDLLARTAGFDVVEQFFDGAGRMSLNLLAPR
jgi:L-histidine N-alpha-methyltransferase